MQLNRCRIVFETQHPLPHDPIALNQTDHVDLALIVRFMGALLALSLFMGNIRGDSGWLIGNRVEIMNIIKYATCIGKG